MSINQWYSGSTKTRGKTWGSHSSLNWKTASESFNYGQPIWLVLEMTWTSTPIGGNFLTVVLLVSKKGQIVTQVTLVPKKTHYCNLIQVRSLMLWNIGNNCAKDCQGLPTAKADIFLSCHFEGHKNLLISLMNDKIWNSLYKLCQLSFFSVKSDHVSSDTKI